jgi:hypothetical protein
MNEVPVNGDLWQCPMRNGIWRCERERGHEGSHRAGIEPNVSYSVSWSSGVSLTKQEAVS